MKRSEVYKLIDGEREYQNSKRPLAGQKDDKDHSVGDWIIFMERLLSEAKNEIYHLDENAALTFVRKATAVGIACMENNDTDPR